MSNPTTPFNWQMPTATDLVTDLPADFEVFGQAVATSMSDLLGGTTGQVLKKNTNTDMDFVWSSDNGILPSNFAAKGDLLVGTGSGTFSTQTVGANGTVLTADSAEADGVKWAAPVSAAPVWTQRRNALTSGNFTMMAFNGTNLFIAVGTAGQLFTSPDAITWTSRTSGFGANDISSVTFGNGLWVIGGSNGNLATSTDGTTWTARTSQFGANAIFNVKYVNSLYFALGAGGPVGGTNAAGLSYSSDGTTWTKATMTGASIGDPCDIEFAGTYYVVTTAAYGANNGGYTTNLNSGWVGANIENLSASRTRIFWNGSAWIYFGNIAASNTMISTTTPPASGTWSAISPRLTSSDTTAVMNAKLSGSTLYAQKDIGTLQTSISTTPWAITSGRWNALGQTFYAPTAGAYTFNVMCLDASNRFVVADSQGRIYTSF